MPSKYFPGIKAKMGRWHYYIVQMTMRDLTMIEFAHQFDEFGGGLSEALQRELKADRAKGEIVQYLINQPDRFFNAIVIAGFGSAPAWYPVTLEDNPELRIIADEELTETFGILKMGDRTHYYALDGQHRLLAIKELLDPAGEFLARRPHGFENETMAVVLVTPTEAEGVDEFRKRFRRLFGNLNRYAKKMDEATNIIMDEDDSIAISLRRLFADHEYFKTVGADKDSTRIFTQKGKNIPAGSQYFTNIEVLYSMCTEVLTSASRLNALSSNGDNLKTFLRFRPDDLVLESMYNELATIWTALIKVFPEFEKTGTEMRDNNITGVPDAKTQNHLLFRPIGQIPLATVVRTVLDSAPSDPTTVDNIVKEIKWLQKIPWDLGELPWRNLVWVEKSGGDTDTQSIWKITEKPGKKIRNFIVSILLTVHSGDRLDDLKDTYFDLITVVPGNQTSRDLLWEQFCDSLKPK